MSHDGYLQPSNFAKQLSREAHKVGDRILRGVRRYIEILEERDLLGREEEIVVAGNLSRQLELQLQDISELAGLLAASPDNVQLYRSILATYRASCVLRSAIVRTLSWSSTGYGQSLEPYFFWEETTGYRSNHFNYDRAGGLRQGELGAIYLNALGIHSDVSPLLTGSCMSAIALIERFLLDKATVLPMRLLLPRKIYFETSFALFCSKKLFDIQTYDSHATDEICTLIDENDPHVLILETLQNFHGLRIIDTQQILRFLSSRTKKSLECVVIDDSALPGAMDPFACIAPDVAFDLFLVVSCSKYLQLGFDLIPAGLIVGKHESLVELGRIGKAGGYLTPETSVWMVPEIDHHMLRERMRVSSETSFAFANEFKKACGSDYIEIAHPGFQADESVRGSELPFWGGLITCVSKRCEDLSPNLAGTRYHKIIQRILADAGDIGISIGDSEGFGFNDPRVHLCKWPDEIPFVRFAFGELRADQIIVLAEICANAFREEGLL